MITNGLRTDRLLLRLVRPADRAPLVERRNDPAVAEYQDWIVPFPAEKAQAEIERVMELDGPTAGRWFMYTVADLDDTDVLGDLVCHVSDDGHTAEIGYTFAHRAWGRGYAVEAAAALVDLLFEMPGISRVEAKLHPANAASAMVLERIGMRFEGHTRLSFWLDDDNSDDWIYGMVRDDHLAWRGRARHRPAEVVLVEITSDSADSVRRLTTHRSQQRFVDPVDASFADALFPEVIDGAAVVPWLRAVEADGDLVGFVMVALTTDAHPEPYLWRLLIDREHQRRGIGTAVLDRLVEQCRSWGDSTLMVSWGPGKGSPAPLYLGYGFVPTGNIVDGEIEARLHSRLRRDPDGPTHPFPHANGLGRAPGR